MTDQNDNTVTRLFSSSAVETDVTLSPADVSGMYNEIGVTDYKLLFLSLVPDLTNVINELDNDNNMQAFAQNLERLLIEAGSIGKQKLLKNGILMMAHADPMLSSKVNGVEHFSIKDPGEIAHEVGIDIDVLESYKKRIPHITRENRAKMVATALKTIRPLQQPQQRINFILKSFAETYQGMDNLEYEAQRDDRFFNHLALDIAINFHAYRQSSPDTIGNMVIELCRPHMQFVTPEGKNLKEAEPYIEEFLDSLWEYAIATARQHDLRTIAGHDFANHLLANLDNPAFDPTPPEKLARSSFRVIEGGFDENTPTKQ